MDVDGDLQASEVVIVIEDVDVLKGMVETTYDEQNMTFSLKTGENDLYIVNLSDENLFWSAVIKRLMTGWTSSRGCWHGSSENYPVMRFRQS